MIKGATCISRHLLSLHKAKACLCIFIEFQNINNGTEQLFNTI